MRSLWRENAWKGMHALCADSPASLLEEGPPCEGVDALDAIAVSMSRVSC